MKIWLYLIFGLWTMSAMAGQQCQSEGVSLVVLGSGGPELDDGRHSSSYLIRHKGKDRVLIDLGAGASTQFEKMAGKFNEIDAILLTHLHVDHSQDLPSFIKGSFFTGRHKDLWVLGPDKNKIMPATSTYVEGLLGEKGAYPYLQEYVSKQSSRYQIQTQDVELESKSIFRKRLTKDLMVSAIPVNHGPVAAVAWRVDIGQCAISFSGDMSNSWGTFASLANKSQWLVANNAIPESARGVARRLHMPPSEIGNIAAQSKAEKLILSHFMNRTLAEPTQQQTLKQIRRFYTGPVVMAEDLMVIDQ